MSVLIHRILVYWFWKFFKFNILETIWHAKIRIHIYSAINILSALIISFQEFPKWFDNQSKARQNSFSIPTTRHSLVGMKTFFIFTKVNEMIALFWLQPIYTAMFSSVQICIQHSGVLGEQNDCFLSENLNLNFSSHLLFEHYRTLYGTSRKVFRYAKCKLWSFMNLKITC